jgi:hypothetical protein
MNGDRNMAIAIQRIADHTNLPLPIDLENPPATPKTQLAPLSSRAE